MAKITPNFGAIMSGAPSYAQNRQVVRQAGQDAASNIGTLANAVTSSIGAYQQMQKDEEEEKRDLERRALISDIMGAWDGVEELSDMELEGMPEDEIQAYQRRSSIFTPEMSDSQKYRRAASLMLPYDEEGANQMLKYADDRDQLEMRLAQDNATKSSQNERVKLQSAYGSTLREAEGIRDNVRALQAASNFDAARKEMARLKPLEQRLKVQYLALNEMSPEAYPMIEQQPDQPQTEDVAGVDKMLLDLAQSAVSPDGKTINTKMFNDLTSEQRREAIKLAKEEQSIRRDAYDFGQRQISDKVKRQEEQLKLEDLEGGTAAQNKAAGFYNIASAAEKNIRPIGKVDLSNYTGVKMNTLIDLFRKNKSTPPEMQAALQWAMPLLRFESGAAIGEQEIGNFINTYIPVQGEDPTTTRQKILARSEIMNSIKNQAGRALSKNIESKGEMETTTRGGKKYQRKKGERRWKLVK